MHDAIADPNAPKAGPATALLSVMMFLQFFLWGAWFVTLGPYMGALGMEATTIGNAYSMAPIAAILSPFFLGVVADRFFPSQVVMSVLHIVGGAILLLIPTIATGTTGADLLVGLVLAHMLCYMPTLGLSNTVAFKTMTNPDAQFPMVRVFGTIGWIVAGVVVGFLATSLHPYADHLVGGLTHDAFEAARSALNAGGSAAGGVDAQTAANVTATVAATEAARAGDPMFFYVAGASGILLGLFSFFLPSTPPPGKGKAVSLGGILGLDALSLLKDRNFLVFAVASTLVCIPLAAYYAFAGLYAGEVGIENVPFKMTFGQMSEILFMLVMPLFFARLGVKWMLAVGMLAWVVRYGLFAGAWGGAGGGHATWMVLGGIVLHGICYDFFFVTGQIYTERTADKKIRAQAQGFLVLLTQGIGMLIGNQLFGRLVEANTVKTQGRPDVVDWQTIWAYPAGFALLILVAFVLLFRQKGTPARPPASPLPHEALRHNEARGAA